MHPADLRHFVPVVVGEGRARHPGAHVYRRIGARHVHQRVAHGLVLQRRAFARRNPVVRAQMRLQPQLELGVAAVAAHRGVDRRQRRGGRREDGVALRRVLEDGVRLHAARPHHVRERHAQRRDARLDGEQVGAGRRLRVVPPVAGAVQQVRAGARQVRAADRQVHRQDLRDMQAGRLRHGATQRGGGDAGLAARDAGGAGIAQVRQIGKVAARVRRAGHADHGLRPAVVLYRHAGGQGRGIAFIAVGRHFGHAPRQVGGRETEIGHAIVDGVEAVGLTAGHLIAAQHLRAHAVQDLDAVFRHRHRRGAGALPVQPRVAPAVDARVQRRRRQGGLHAADALDQRCVQVVGAVEDVHRIQVRIGLQLRLVFGRRGGNEVGAAGRGIRTEGLGDHFGLRVSRADQVEAGQRLLRRRAVCAHAVLEQDGHVLRDE